MDEKRTPKSSIPEPITQGQILAAASESIQKSMLPAIQVSAELQKSIQKMMLPSIQVSADLQKSIQKSMFPSVQIFADLKRASESIQKSMAPSVEIFAELQKVGESIQKSMAPIIQASADLQKSVQKSMAPIIQASADLQKSIQKSILPDIQTSVELQKSIQKSISPTIQASAKLSKLVDALKPQIDANLILQNSTPQIAKFAAEVKKTLDIRDIGPTVEMLNRLISQFDDTMEPMIISRFISRNAQEWLKSRNISYADATGNFMLASPVIHMYWSDSGADTDPWRKPGRPRTSLYGNAPARIIRALIDTKPPMSVPELIKRSNSSSGVAYRTLEFLENENLVSRNGKLIDEVNWPKIIERWSDDYSFQRNNSVIGFLEPRGLTVSLKKLEGIPNSEYAITGSFAAQRYAPYAEPRQLMMYAKRPIELAESLGLRAVDTGANVLIAATAFDVVFERTIREKGLNYVAVSQAAVDLLNGPGRNPAEGRELVDWMVQNENDWRK